MDLSISGLASSLLFSVIGFWLLREGKRSGNIPLSITGVLMIAATYLTSSPLADWGVGFALCGAAYYFWNQN